MKSTQFHILALLRWQCSVKWSVLRERQVMNLSAVTLGNREVQCPLWPAYALTKAAGGDSKHYLSFVVTSGIHLVEAALVSVA